MEFSILKSLPEDTRRGLLAAARHRKFARGEVIFHEGDPADTLHLIAKGRVAVRVSTRLGETATLSVLGRDDFFGELALISHGERTATVVALEPTETMAI